MKTIIGFLFLIISIGHSNKVGIGVFLQGGGGINYRSAEGICIPIVFQDRILHNFEIGLGRHSKTNKSGQTETLIAENKLLFSYFLLFKTMSPTENIFLWFGPGISLDHVSTSVEIKGSPFNIENADTKEYSNSWRYFLELSPEYLFSEHLSLRGGVSLGLMFPDSYSYYSWSSAGQPESEYVLSTQSKIIVNFYF